MCKRSNALSRPVLMGRGLDGYFLSLSLDVRPLCSFEGPASRRPVTSFGGYSEGETPLPIPNREVKPLSADGTWPARARESRSPPVFIVGRPSGRPVFVPRRPRRTITVSGRDRHGRP